jgi:excisionase family DNA binding protein
MVEDTQKELFSVQEAAEFLGVSASTVRRYISDGRLLAYRLGNERLIRIKQQDLYELLSPINNSNSEKKHADALRD